MKIVFTVSDGDGAYHIGLNVEHVSGIVDIPDDSLPECVQQLFRDRQWAKEDPEHRHCYRSLSISALE